MTATYVQRALNRGEAYHQLRRAIANVNGGKFRGSSDSEIDLWNECARLLTNAIIYFNSRILSDLLGHFERNGDKKYPRCHSTHTKQLFLLLKG